jgi:hypothetical protein
MPGRLIFLYIGGNGLSLNVIEIWKRDDRSCSLGRLIAEKEIIQT